MHVPDAGVILLPAADGDQMREHGRGPGIDGEFAAGPDIRALWRKARWPMKNMTRIRFRAHGQESSLLARLYYY